MSTHTSTQRFLIFERRRNSGGMFTTFYNLHQRHLFEYLFNNRLQISSDFVHLTTCWVLLSRYIFTFTRSLFYFTMDVDMEEACEDVLKTRLGTCEKCGTNEAKYTCPRCEFRSCCLQCVNLHKKEFDCNGIRDKTRFKSVSQFTELDLLSGK